MTQRFTWGHAFAIVGMSLLLLAGTAWGQDAEDRDTWAGGEELWTNDDNWVDAGGQVSGAPSPVDADRWAQVNDGTVLVDGNVGTSGLTVNGGIVQISDGSSLTIDVVENAFSVGQTEIGGGGTIRLVGDSKLTGLDVNNRGELEFASPNAAVETKGDFSTSGTLQLNIAGDGASSIKVDGTATIGGVISPVFDASPAFGDSFEFVSGASSVVLNNPVVALPETVTLSRGLKALVDTDGTSASLAIGNVPVVQLDRVAGTTKILNVVGGELAITGYTVDSANGLLNSDAFTPSGADGFVAPNPLNTSLSEISLENQLTLAVGDEINIGGVYNAGATHPDDEDVRFRFSTPSGRVLDGLVEYIGPANDFVANVNPETGEVSLYHLSANIDPVDITGYTIASASESLDVNAFTGIGEEGWVGANSLAGRISELNLESSKVFANGTVVSLGNIFKTDGARDIEVQYSTADHLLVTATVEYGEIPGQVALCDPNTGGDLDGNGTVEFADFLALSANFGSNVASHTQGDVDCNGTVEFADFLALSANFGQTSGGGASSVPEPASLPLLGLAGAMVTLLRQRRQS